MKNLSNILWGIIFIVIGLIVGLNTLGVTDINIFFDGWWTLFIIVPCFIGLFKEKDKKGDIIGLTIGLALLMCCQGLLSFDLVLKLSVPFVLIVIGLSFIFKDLFNNKISKEIKKLNAKKDIEGGVCATFSEQNISFDNEKFIGANLTAIFGGVKCDLRKAIIEKDVVINAESIFGGIEIYVPENINVKVKSNSVFGGVDNKRDANANKECSYTIYINATCIFGGIDIK